MGGGGHPPDPLLGLLCGALGAMVEGVGEDYERREHNECDRGQEPVGDHHPDGGDEHHHCDAARVGERVHDVDPGLDVCAGVREQSPGRVGAVKGERHPQVVLGNLVAQASLDRRPRPVGERPPAADPDGLDDADRDYPADDGEEGAPGDVVVGASREAGPDHAVDRPAEHPGLRDSRGGIHRRREHGDGESAGRLGDEETDDPPASPDDLALGRLGSGHNPSMLADMPLQRR